MLQPPRDLVDQVAPEDPVVLECPHGYKRRRFHFHYLRLRSKQEVLVVRVDPEVPLSHLAHWRKIPLVISGSSNNSEYFLLQSFSLLDVAFSVQLNSAGKRGNFVLLFLYLA